MCFGVVHSLHNYNIEQFLCSGSPSRKSSMYNSPIPTSKVTAQHKNLTLVCKNKMARGWGQEASSTRAFSTVASEGLGGLCLCLCLAGKGQGPKGVACTASRGSPRGGGPLLSTLLRPRCSCSPPPLSTEGWEVPSRCELSRKETGLGSSRLVPTPGTRTSPRRFPGARPTQRGVWGLHLPLNFTGTDYHSKQNL